AGEPPKIDMTDYVFAAQDLADWRKDVNDGDYLKDANLKNRSRPSQGVTALLMRAKRENGKIQEIQVFYSKIREPKVAPVRQKPLTADDPDFKYLMKAMGTTE